MPTKRRKKAPTNSREGGALEVRPDNGDVIWTNPQPNAEDVRVLESDSYDFLAALVTLYDELSPGDRVTCKYDLRSTRWLGIYFRSPGDADMPIQALSVRGATPLDALVLLAYFHLVRFQGNWGGESLPISSRFG